jgi:ZIP family zinc transporter
MDGSVILLGFSASVLAGLATGIGAIPVLFITKISERLEKTLLGFAGGVMLSASFFSLILPGLDYAEAISGTRSEAALVVSAAVLLGAGVLAFLNHHVPHEHFVSGQSGVKSRTLRRIWLFVIAITLHNFPEGLAVGVGFGSGNLERATTLAIGIGLQNIPEGLAVAAALVSQKYSRLAAAAIATSTGLVEPIGGILGVTAVSLFSQTLPWGLGFAAGAMIFVISNEIVPETHKKGHEDFATAGLMVGVVVMMMLDMTFK